MLDELKTSLLEAGIVGAGGAGFPSYAKLNEKADTIKQVANNICILLR